MDSLLKILLRLPEKPSLWAIGYGGFPSLSSNYKKSREGTRAVL
jgi:hypothetical protein